jgi:hypothetical protein
MLPPATDLFALLGLSLVLCAIARRAAGSRRWAQWSVTGFFLLLWLPVGPARLPVVAYVRGISSDPSVTLIALAGLSMVQRFMGRPLFKRRDYTALFAGVALAAVFLYPLALGLGDWDAYRLGWDARSLWLALLVISLLFLSRGLRLLPALVCLALLAWAAGALESANLWDYLIDPWLVIFSIFRCLKILGSRVFRPSAPVKSGTAAGDV